MKPILFTFAFAATLAAQKFIQMSDPKFGMFTKEALPIRGASMGNIENATRCL